VGNSSIHIRARVCRDSASCAAEFVVEISLAAVVLWERLSCAEDPDVMGEIQSCKWIFIGLLN